MKTANLTGKILNGLWNVLVGSRTRHAAMLLSHSYWYIFISCAGFPSQQKESPLVREFGFRNPRSFARGIRKPETFCLWNPESWTLESGISLKIGVRNPSPPSETGIQCVESGIHGVESGMQGNLGFLYMGRKKTHKKGMDNNFHWRWLVLAFHIT